MWRSELCNSLTGNWMMSLIFFLLFQWKLEKVLHRPRIWYCVKFLTEYCIQKFTKSHYFLTKWSFFIWEHHTHYTHSIFPYFCSKTTKNWFILNRNRILAVENKCMRSYWMQLSHVKWFEQNAHAFLFFVVIGEKIINVSSALCA